MSFASFLPRADILQFLFGAEAGVCLALPHELLGIGAVYFGAFALTVGAVIAFIAAADGALVKLHTELGKCVDYKLHTVFNGAFGIRILDTQKKYAAGCMRKPFIGKSAVKVADMHKSRGAGCEPGDLCPFGKHACGVARLDIGGQCFYMRKQKLCKTVVVHNSSVKVSNNIILYPRAADLSIAMPLCFC